ncbi:MAG: hypothetical protein AB1679_00265 [Actinomycetota bacterium]
MSEDRSIRPFSIPPFVGLFAPQVVGSEPYGSSSDIGRLQLSGGMRRLAAQLDAVEAWWNQADPLLSEDLHPEFRRLLLAEMREKIEFLAANLRSLDAALTTVAVGDAYESAENDSQVLMHRARRWNFPWALAQEKEACIAADPLDDPGGFLAQLERRLRDA